MVLKVPRGRSKQCVALLQHYTTLPYTSLWKKGQLIFGNSVISEGAAVTTLLIR